MIYLSWAAVALLSISYWFQIYKIHVHKEVRDLSVTYHVLLALGFGILTYTAWMENSKIFLIKQIATTIPVVVIIAQIYIHRKDHWHEVDNIKCDACDFELEHEWNVCPNCGDVLKEAINPS